LHRVWEGQLELALALQQGLIALEGPPDLCRSFPRWLKLSHFVERARDAAVSG
jgi:hypothetical protein